MKVLWTDGSASPNPGPGGFAVIWQKEDGTAEPVVLGREDRSTNIRMEGRALMAAIQYAGEEGCEIHSDSEFWINVLKKWAPAWQRNEWHKAADRKVDKDGRFMGWKVSSIKNLDIVKELYELYCTHPVELVWEKGHVGTDLNELADKMANKARKGYQLG
ncbi:ribonuclease HI [Candidatus Saccharibacteria bacterium]|nr:ribonuclease HI [Candidatus Saccharibacteria bacterium]